MNEAISVITSSPIVTSRAEFTFDAASRAEFTFDAAVSPK